MGYWKLLFFLSHIIINFVCLTVAQLSYKYCTGDNSTSSMYETNKNTLLSSLAPTIGRNGFYNSSVGQNTDRVNAVVLCRGDVELDICRSCVNDSSRNLVQLCPNYHEAIGWYDKCMIRFSNNTIFHTLDITPDMLLYNTNNVSDVVQFNQALRTLLDSLRSQAASGDSLRKFATGKISGPDFLTIYAHSQCTPDLSNIQCNDCLDGTARQIPSCCNGRVGARLLRPSCNIRYEIERFYNETPAAPQSSPPPPPPGKDNSTTRIVIIIVMPIVISVILIMFICTFLRKRKHWKPKEKFETTDAISSMETLQYDFGTIRIATDNFCDNNKLGQGGFGAVYKGRLPNGKEVAVKRLSGNSGQGEQEFKNEVLLVVKLQHRNLIRLLGFSLEGSERLLIYEFLPNRSLDHFLFDPIRREQLDWNRRSKIIRGVARGLLYLHEDSQLRIIHRDLKASNILLDADMNSKISDFGMARLFAVDETQGNTNKIAGTYGYMAPEYAIYGQFSIKSDVFSFGVLVLEIVSSQKNHSFQHGENVEDLLSYAWKNWQDGTTSNLIDPNLRVGSGSVRDMMRCIHIGLLCVQENAADRPTMATVVLMLNSFSITLPIPSQPAFFMDSSIDPEMPLQWEYDSGATQTSKSKTMKSKFGRESKNEASISELYPR